jgi:hypothetical protein
VDSWLFDTGGSVSLISSTQAAALGSPGKRFPEWMKTGIPDRLQLVDEGGNVLPISSRRT